MNPNTPEHAPPRPSVFIVGSCVTRDAFALAGHGYAILDYVARSSFACSMSGEPFPVGLSAIDSEGAVQSNWQRRMVEIDLTRGLRARLRGVADAELEIGEAIFLGGDAHRFRVDVDANDADLGVQERQLIGSRAGAAAHLGDA